MIPAREVSGTGFFRLEVIAPAGIRQSLLSVQGLEGLPGSLPQVGGRTVRVLPGRRDLHAGQGGPPPAASDPGQHPRPGRHTGLVQPEAGVSGLPRQRTQSAGPVSLRPGRLHLSGLTAPPVRDRPVPLGNRWAGSHFPPQGHVTPLGHRPAFHGTRAREEV